MSDNDDEVEFIDKKEVIYCGSKEDVPFGYDRKGTSSECFKTGLGVGFAKSKEDLKRTEIENRVRVLTNLEVLRLANRLGIVTVNEDEDDQPLSREDLLKGIIKRLGKMETFFEENLI